MKPLHILVIAIGTLFTFSGSQILAEPAQSKPQELTTNQKIDRAYKMFVNARKEKSVDKMAQAIAILDKEMPAKSQLTATQGPDMVDVFIKELKAHGGNYERKPKPKTRGFQSIINLFSNNSYSSSNCSSIFSNFTLK